MKHERQHIVKTRRNLILSISLCCLTAALVVWSGGNFETRADASQSDKAPGIKIGKKAPALTLNDAHGKPWKSSDHLEKEKFTAYLFYRSADW